MKHIKGWINDRFQTPPRSGEYLCLLKWANQSNYETKVISWSSEEDLWLDITDSVEDVWWTEFTPELFVKSLELLRDLADLQNGPPLEQHREEWEETMKEVYEFLNKYE